MLNSKEFQWLSKPPNYVNGNYSYFTEDGYKWFNQYTLPLMIPYLDQKKIKVEKVNSLKNIVYQDQFQVVVGKA